MRSKQLDLYKFESRVGEHRLKITDEKFDRLMAKPHLIYGGVPEPTVASFSDWVFELDHGKRYAPQQVKRAKLTEIRKNIADVLSRNADNEIGEWDLVSHDDGSKNAPIYESSVLTLNGSPLKMKPDVVWRNKVTGLIAIFEYKVASDWVFVPDRGWPNLATQLWAYAWADAWKDQRELLLIGGIFKGESERLSDVIPRTSKSDIKFNKACSTLFKAWGGEIHLSRLSNACRKYLVA